MPRPRVSTLIKHRPLLLVRTPHCGHTVWGKTNITSITDFTQTSSANPTPKTHPGIFPRLLRFRIQGNPDFGGHLEAPFPKSPVQSKHALSWPLKKPLTHYLEEFSGLAETPRVQSMTIEPLPISPDLWLMSFCMQLIGWDHHRHAFEMVQVEKFRK